MRPPSCLALLAAVLSPLVVLSGGGASAQTAEPTPAPTASPAPAVSRLVVVRDADSGRSVVLSPGQLLRVELGAAGAPWQGLETSTPGLQLTGYDAAVSGLGASFEVLAPAPPQTLVATAGDRRWELVVEVGPGEARAPRTCAPASPTAGPTGTPAASAVPSASATPRPGLVLGAGSDGGRFRIQADDPVFVGLASCAQPFGPVVVTGPLQRQQAGSSVSDGSAEANLRPTGAGTATLTAQRDAPCASRAGAVCPTPWTVVLDVEPAPCTLSLTGPASVPVGGTADLTGRAEPGESVSVLFRRRGETVFTVRRTLTAGPDGAFSTSFVPVDDHRFSATGSRCSTAPGLVQVLPTAAGPARVARGAQARLEVRAAAGSAVAVLFRRAGTTTWRTGRTGTADAAGRFRTSIRPDVDHAYYATSLGRRSAVRVVQAR